MHVPIGSLHVRIGSLFAGPHGNNLGHRMIDVLDTAVGTGMVGAGGHLVHAEALVDGAGDLGANL